MTENTRHIHGYYSPNGLYEKIINGLNELGRDLSAITLDDLHAVDEFHIRGDAATRELIELSEFTSDMRILDIGCGIGGSTRRLSQQTRCQVTGIDLSNEYIDVAQRLTQLVNMQNQVDFHACSALDLPFDDHTFDGVWSLQMNMNIADKLLWLTETCRVLKPGGRAVLYEVCGRENKEIYFPVPWAQDRTMSFLESPETFRQILSSAGFDVDVWNDRSDLAQQSFAKAKIPVGKPKLPVLGVHLLVGDDIQTKAYNLRRNLEEKRVSLIEAVAVKPDKQLR